MKKIKNKRTARGPRRWSSSLAVTAEVAPGHVCTHVYVCVHRPFAGTWSFLFSIITAKISKEYVMEIRRFWLKDIHYTIIIIVVDILL